MPVRLKAIEDSSGKTHELGDFTILVGPNNCGKSQTLRDIRDYITIGSRDRLTVIRGLTLDMPGLSEVQAGLKVFPHPNAPDHIMLRGVSSDLKSVHEVALPTGWLERVLSYANSDAGQLTEFLRQIGKYLIAHLDAESRFMLANPTSSYDTRKEWPSNAMQAFFAQRREALPELRGAFREAFDMDIALDWAAMKTLTLRVSSDFGVIPDTLAELDALLNEKPELLTQGDGYRSFAGVALSMLTFPTRLLLLDEPEAFLHPAQARTLGRWVGRHAAKRAAQVILATHSADFLWGAVSANPNTSVVRLNRTENSTKFHFVSSSTVAGLAQSPLLSSQPVLDALFQRGVCICEGDPDRAVYEAVAHNHTDAARGSEILFIHTNGKDAIDVPVALLREAGTPVCAIVDIDVLNSEEVLTKIATALGGLDTSQFPVTLGAIGALVESTNKDDLLKRLREAVQAWQETPYSDVRRAKRVLVALAKGASKWDAVKKRGLEFFEESGRATVESFLQHCKQGGLFIVPKGELEGWLKLGVSKGRTWNRRALEQLHSSDAPAELRSFVGGVIQFLDPS